MNHKEKQNKTKTHNKVTEKQRSCCKATITLVSMDRILSGNFRILPSKASIIHRVYISHHILQVREVWEAIIRRFHFPDTESERFQVHHRLMQ